MVVVAHDLAVSELRPVQVEHVINKVMHNPVWMLYVGPIEDNLQINTRLTRNVNSTLFAGTLHTD